MSLVLTLALLFATWLLWSGIYTPWLLGLGAVACVVVVILARRIGFFEAGFYTLGLMPRLPAYWGWLLLEIVRGNLAVVRIVLHPRLPISPCLMTVDAKELAQVSQATLANSITLTPGTLSTDIDRGRIEVHCLTRAFAEDVLRGEMLRRAQQLEGN